VCLAEERSMRYVRAGLCAGLLTSAALMAVAMPAAAEEWSKTYSIAGKPDLHVETTEANIHVSTWDRNEIEAKVQADGYKIGGGGIRIDERQNGSEVDLEVHFPREHGIIINFGNHGWHRVDVNIHMPREGQVNLHTGDGEIDVSQFKGEMQLRSSDGSQELTGVDGKLVAVAGDGHIRAKGRFDDLELKTGDGRIDATANSGSKLMAPWRIETGDGGVNLEIPEALAADVDLHTGDGHIDLDVPVVVTVGRIREHDIQGKINGGGNLLIIHTGDGSIRLRRG